MTDRWHCKIYGNSGCQKMRNKNGTSSCWWKNEKKRYFRLGWENISCEGENISYNVLLMRFEPLRFTFYDCGNHWFGKMNTFSERLHVDCGNSLFIFTQLVFIQEVSFQRDFISLIKFVRIGNGGIRSEPFPCNHGTRRKSSRCKKWCIPGTDLRDVRSFYRGSH